MEYTGRRNRRGRDRRGRQGVPPQAFVIPPSPRRWSLMDGLSSFFIMSSLLAIIYLMLDYHCNSCITKCDLTNITLNIDDISKNLTAMRRSYKDLETKVMNISYELPKIGGQIEILEAIANTMERGDYKKPKEYTMPEDTVGLKFKLEEKDVETFTQVFPKQAVMIQQD